MGGRALFPEPMGRYPHRLQHDTWPLGRKSLNGKFCDSLGWRGMHVRWPLGLYVGLLAHADKTRLIGAFRFQAGAAVASTFVPLRPTQHLPWRRMHRLTDHVIPKLS